MTNAMFTYGAIAVAAINELASEQALCCGDAARIRSDRVEVKSTALALVFGSLPAGRLRAWYPVTPVVAAAYMGAHRTDAARRLSRALYLAASALG